MLIQRNIAVPKKSKKSAEKHRCDFLAYFHISYFSEDLWVTYVESSDFSGLGWDKNITSEFLCLPCSWIIQLNKNKTKYLESNLPLAFNVLEKVAS